MQTETNFWADADIISTYTRAQALADGVLFDASTGELGEVSAEHFKYPIAMTAAVHALIETAVSNPHWGNDWKGVWHDVLWMVRRTGRVVDESTRVFKVIITGAGGNDDLSPCLTVMLASED